MNVKRSFVDIDEGQVHYRYKGSFEKEPLIMLHPGPTSSHSIVPLIDIVGKKRFVIAPDILGMGDSVGPNISNPDMSYFADAIFRTLDALNVDNFDLWGCMTGAHCAIEMSLQNKDRVKNLYIEFLQFYDEETQSLLEKGHAPEIEFDHHGSQFNLLWHLARDQHLFFPWFVRDKKHSRPNGLPSPKQLHEKTVELLKAAETYHYALNAALRYPTIEKLSNLSIPVFGPATLEPYVEDLTITEKFCVSPSTSNERNVEDSAKEIFKHLKIL